MDQEKLIGYVIAGSISLIFWIIQQRLADRPKVGFWVPHTVMFSVPITQTSAASDQAKDISQSAPNSLLIQTNTLAIQNLGRKTAECLEIVHERRPDHYQFQGGVNFSESINPRGQHVIRVEHLGPREAISLHLLSYANLPQLVAIHSKDGPATSTRFRIQREFPIAINITATILVFVGGFSLLYWLARATIYISTATGML